MSSILLAFIGGIFVYKYSARVMDYPLILGVAYSLCFLGSVRGLSLYLSRRVDTTLSARSKQRWITLAVIAIACALLLAIMYPGAGRVARLPAIQVWLERLLGGTYPYGPPVAPSGFPGLYLLGLPFYALGIENVIPAVGVGLMVGVLALLGAKKDSGNRAVWVGLFVLTVLPTTFYEVLLKSDLLFVMALSMIVIMLADSRLLSAESGSSISVGTLLVLGLLLGLLSSTRLTIALLVGMYMVWRFRSDYKSLLTLGLICACSALLLVLPFALWDWATFSDYGPFAIQTMYSPQVVSITISCIGLFVARRSSSLVGVFVCAGYTFFALVMVAFFIAIIRDGVGAAVFQSSFDITYFTFSVPGLAGTYFLSD